MLEILICYEFGQQSQTHADMNGQDAVHVSGVVGVELVEKAEGNVSVHVAAFVCTLSEEERNTKLMRISHCSSGDHPGQRFPVNSHAETFCETRLQVARVWTVWRVLGKC